MVFVEEEAWVVLTDAPEDYLDRAQQELDQGKRKEASGDLQKAAALLSLQANAASGEEQQVLQQTSRDLQALASRAEKEGRGERMKQGFARVYRDLAHGHHLRAAAHWAKDEGKKAGHNLAAAARDMERAAAFSGREAEKAVSATVRDTRRLAGDLITGVGLAPKAVGDGIAAVGTGIERLGQFVKPHEPSRAARRPQQQTPPEQPQRKTAP
jgi:hypothetical protein